MESKEKEGDDKEFLPGYQTVQEFSTNGFKRVVGGVKAFQALPQPGPSWDLYKSYPEFSRAMKSARSKLIPMMTTLLRHVNIPTSDFRSRDVDEKFEFIVDSNDTLLERIGSSLDEAEGLFKKSEILVIDKGAANSSFKVPGTWGKRKLDRINNSSSNDPDSTSDKSEDTSNRPIKKAVFRFRVTEKPQLKFSQPVDNSLSPFVPKLKEKPHSLKPLSILPEYNAKNEEFYGHPYTVELNKWEPRDDMLTKVTPQPPKSLKDTPVVYVATPRDLERLMYDLLNKKEISVDLEHHSFRTYLGITCLIQISSREKDYVIDGLALRDELSHLNEIFTDPKVLKVFHGSNNDIDWLQRDFGLYIVNMFDTYIAAKALGLPQQSLQYLLGKYCNVSQNKSLQLADWRLRPLTDEMVEYARGDTHYLLYIYEQLRNELVESGNQHNNLLLSVFDQSRQSCLRRYEKPVSNAQLALRKTRRSINNRQLYAFTELYKWRDETAREKDESWGYVLPNHMMLTISESLPKEMNGILACCDPVPPLIHSNLGKIHKIITIARELPLRQENVQTDKVVKKAKLKNWVIVVNSIHDVVPADIPEDAEGENSNEEENISEIPNDPANTSGTWPQPWVDPGGWEKYVCTDSEPSLKLARARLSIRRALSQRSQSQSQPPPPIVDSSGDTLATPFGRYEASKKIMDMLKDPKKQKDIDLDDPLVKAVYETVLVEDVEVNNGDSDDDEEPVTEPARVLDDGEFIPFNPLAQSSSKRRKKPKREAWEDGAQVKDEPLESNSLGIGLDNSFKMGDEDVVDDDDLADQNDSNSKQQSFMQASKDKRNKKKGKKGKFLNRLKNAFSRNKNKRSDNAVEEDGDANNDNEELESGKGKECPMSTSESADSLAPPNKRMRRSGQHSNFEEEQQRDTRNNRTRRGNQSANQRSSPRQNRWNNKKNSGQNDKAKPKTAIFNAWKKGSRSMTFN